MDLIVVLGWYRALFITFNEVAIDKNNGKTGATTHFVKNCDSLA